jgi:hypothetical protein
MLRCESGRTMDVWWTSELMSERDMRLWEICAMIEVMARCQSSPSDSKMKRLADKEEQYESKVRIIANCVGVGSADGCLW